jgi:hypothetical protein
MLPGRQTLFEVIGTHLQVSDSLRNGGLLWIGAKDNLTRPDIPVSIRDTYFSDSMQSGLGKCLCESIYFIVALLWARCPD